MNRAVVVAEAAGQIERGTPPQGSCPCRLRFAQGAPSSCRALAATGPRSRRWSRSRALRCTQPRQAGKHSSRRSIHHRCIVLRRAADTQRSMGCCRRIPPLALAAAPRRRSGARTSWGPHQAARAGCTATHTPPCSRRSIHRRKSRRRHRMPRPPPARHCHSALETARGSCGCHRAQRIGGYRSPPPACPTAQTARRSSRTCARQAQTCVRSRSCVQARAPS